MNNTQTEFKIGDIIEGEVYKITKFGAFVKLPMGKKGLIHISQISDDFVENISEYLKIGDQAKVRIIAIDGNKIDLTLKLRDYVSSYPKDKDFRGSDLEDKLDFLYTKTKKTMRGGAVR